MGNAVSYYREKEYQKAFEYAQRALHIDHINEESLEVLLASMVVSDDISQFEITSKLWKIIASACMEVTRQHDMLSLLSKVM